jgi:hypothetical protein
MSSSENWSQLVSVTVLSSSAGCTGGSDRFMVYCGVTLGQEDSAILWSVAKNLVQQLLS